MVNGLLLGFCLICYVRNRCILVLSSRAWRAEWLTRVQQMASISLPHGYALWPPSWLLFCVPAQQELVMALCKLLRSVSGILISYPFRTFFLFYLLCVSLALPTSMARSGTDLDRLLYTTLEQTFSQPHTLQRRQCPCLPVIRASTLYNLFYITCLA